MAITTRTFGFIEPAKERNEGKSVLHRISYHLAPNSFNVVDFSLDNDEYKPLPNRQPEKGRFGAVTVFSNNQNRLMVVKVPHEPVSDTSTHRKWHQNEVHYLEKLYGEEGVYAIDIYIIRKKHKYFSFAIFVPFFPENNLDIVLAQASTENFVLMCLLSTTKEILRVNDKEDIFQNDIKCDNIRIDTRTFTARLIDFFYATEQGDRNKRYYSATKPDAIEIHTAPSLRGEISGDHIPNRDSEIYSFGFMLREILLKATAWIQTHDPDIFLPQSNLYPNFIWEFQNLLLSGRPERRPNLEAFIFCIENYMKQPRICKLQFAFAKTDFSQMQLKITDQYYESKMTIQSGAGGIVKVYDTSEGMIRIKYETNSNYSTEAIDEMAYSAALYEEKLPDLNRIHCIATHPFYQPQCTHSFFSATRYRDGNSFDEYAKTTLPSLSTLQQLRLLISIFEALREAHEKGYVIGNIKPKNIIINDTVPGSSKPKISFNNLRWAGRLDAPYAKTTEFPPRPNRHWHPDKCTVQLIAPHVNHDDYPLAMALDYILTSFSDPEIQYLIGKYFLEAVTNTDVKRPRLLEDALKWFKNFEQELQQANNNVIPPAENIAQVQP